LFIFSSVIFIPLSILLYGGALPIIRAVFGYGQYSDAAIIATSEVFGYYCLGFWAYMLRSILIRFYSSQQDIHSIGRAAMIDFFVHLFVIFLLIEKIGIATFGVATTIGYLVSLGYLLLYYPRFKKMDRALFQTRTPRDVNGSS
jgi:peptidoglycan biosynthesis protein MviN/MurJ (putative lipid II flippase)